MQAAPCPRLLPVLVLLGAIGALAPGAARATPVTITFDRGAYDTTISDPTGEFHGPYDWLESGVRIRGFWTRNVGSPAGEYVLGHTHLQEDLFNPTGIAEFTHAHTGDLLGLEISLQGGGSFDLVSVDYHIDLREAPAEDFQLQRLTWSIPASSPRILTATRFDPRLADFESQWTAHPTMVDADEATQDWYTAVLTGAAHTNLTRVMISQTAAQTWLDNIVIDVHAGSHPVPQPTTALLLGLGLAALAARHRA